MCCMCCWQFVLIDALRLSISGRCVLKQRPREQIEESQFGKFLYAMNSVLRDTSTQLFLLILQQPTPKSFISATFSRTT